MTPRAGRAEEPAGRRRRVRWTNRALTDLADIVLFIAADDLDATLRWRATILDAADAVGPMPFVGRAVPEMGRSDVRELIKGNYRIVYAVRAERIDVLAVIEGHRRMPRDLDPDVDE